MLTCGQSWISKKKMKMVRPPLNSEGGSLTGFVMWRNAVCQGIHRLRKHVLASFHMGTPLPPGMLVVISDPFTNLHLGY